MERLTEAQQEAVKALERGKGVIASLARSRVVSGFNAVPSSLHPLAGAIANPAKFWGMAAVDSLTNGENTSEQDELLEASIKLAAAKLKSGDFEFIRESLLGQATWLHATAVRLMALTAEVPDGPNADEKRAELVRLSLKASDQAAKLLASAAALNAIGGGAGVTVV